MTSNIIKLEAKVQQIVIDPADRGIAVISAGPQGPRGLQGPPGNNGAAVAYVHVQETESVSWLINHDLGFHPNVSVENQAGNIVECGIVHHSDDQIELQFLVPKAGTARLS